MSDANGPEHKENHGGIVARQPEGGSFIDVIRNHETLGLSIGQDRGSTGWERRSWWRRPQEHE